MLRTSGEMYRVHLASQGGEMDTSDWIALGAVTVAVASVGFSWRATHHAGRSAEASERAAVASERSASATERHAALSERAEALQQADRDDNDGPTFKGTRTRLFNGEALLVFHQTDGPDLGSVIAEITAPGVVGLSATERGSTTDRVPLDVLTIRTSAKVFFPVTNPPRHLRGVLRLRCSERDGTRMWTRDMPFHCGPKSTPDGF